MNESQDVITLTPELAKSLLAVNKINRPLTRSTVDRYARSIKNNEWMLNGESIKISDEGYLLDGQHRCHAVIQTGVPIQTYVCRGLDREAFKTIDTGRNRKASDVLAIAGEKHTHTLGSAARHFLTYDNPYKSGTLTHTELLEAVSKHPEIRYWVGRYISAGKVKKFMPSSFPGLLAVASRKYGFDVIEKFFEQVNDGNNLSATDPAFVLRERFMTLKRGQTLTYIIQNAFIIKAINAHVKGKKISILRMSDGEQFPQFV